MLSNARKRLKISDQNEYKEKEKEEEQENMGENEEDDYEAGFEEEIKLGEEEEEEEEGEENVLLKQKSLMEGGNPSWKRPEVVPIDPKKESLSVQCFEIDSFVTFPAPIGYSMLQEKQKQAQIRIYGVNEHGNSVLVYVHNFFPYFFVPLFKNATPSSINSFASQLDHLLKTSDRHSKQAAYIKRFVVKVEKVSRQSIYGYQVDPNSDFLKLTFSLPNFLSTARYILEKGFTVHEVGFVSFQTFESNMVYPLRYMIDKNIRGGGWIELPIGSYKVRPAEHHSSYCQVEVDVDHSSLIGHNPDGNWSKMSAARVLSFDIECAGRKGFFPNAEIDPIIQIACYVSLQTSADKPFISTIFTLNSCSAIAGTQVLCFETEEELLMNWLRFLIQVDPEWITGYNIINFDLPYLLNRAKTLKLDDFAYLGRICHRATTMKDSRFESKAIGIRESKSISIDGRIQFDVLDLIRREYKLRSYTLNAVSAHFLNSQKEDVHHSIITDLQNGTDETRRRLAVYCLKDALLPLQLIHKLMFITNSVEMARVTGVPINYLLTRGQQIKVVSQLYRKAKQRDYVIPTQKPNPMDEKYEGATVIEPIRGYYTSPIATLDFASLYPSIMMAHNLCYSTLVSPHLKNKIQEQKIEHKVTPNGDMFVKQTVRKGVLPEILQELLNARSDAKKLMKKAKDPLEYAVLNGRQLALKISANSVYGFTGAQVGQLPCLAISSSVTAYGRVMIHHTKNKVEELYTVKNGYAFDAQVIYGDTDSVMIKFGPSEVKDVMQLGKEAAVRITKEFESPIQLEFEKVYFPYLLMNKKRYAGLYWTNPEKHDKLDSKGIETNRRDSCLLVKKSIDDSLEILLEQRDKNKAIEYCKTLISDLLMNRTDISLLVLSKGLGRTDYKSKAVHVVLAEKMRKRDPLSAPSVGDRVPYLIIQSSKNAKTYEKGEDPQYVLEHGLPIDAHYYINNQLRQPLGRIFEPIVGSHGLKLLFEGDHTRRIKNASVMTSNNPLMKFLSTTGRRCLGCRALLEEQEKVVCTACAPRAASLYIKHVDQLREQEKIASETWVTCHNCQDSHEEILCQNKDCGLFYKRIKVKKDLKEARIILDRFHFDDTPLVSSEPS